MKRNFILFFILTAFIYSCSNSKGPGPDIPPVIIVTKPPEPETPYTLDESKLKGSWQLYNFTKTVNDDRPNITKPPQNGQPYRYPQHDGLWIIFKDNFKYDEINVFENYIVENGTYTILAADPNLGETKPIRMQLDFVSPFTGDDTVVITRVPLLSQHRIQQQERYRFRESLGDKVVVTDDKYYRKKGLEQYTWDVDKTKGTVTFAKLKGKWLIEKFYKNDAGTGMWDPKPIGQWVEFSDNGKFRYGKEDEVWDEGKFYLEGDVVNFYYEITEGETMTSSLLWVSEWIDSNNFKAKDEYLHPTKTTPIKIVKYEATTWFQKEN